MIKWIALFFCLFSIELNAQIDLKNLKLTDSNLNILYRGIENRILVTGLEFDTTLKLISTNSQVHRSEINFNNKNYFYLSPSSLKDDTLKLYKRNKLLLTKIYKVEIVGNPKIQFGNTSDTVLSVKQILSNPKLNVVIPNSYYKHQFVVWNFNLYYYNSNNELIYQIENLNNYKFSEFEKPFIEKLQSGDKMIFKRIIVTGPDCENRRLSDLTLTIK